MLKGGAEAIAFCIADKSLTSSTSASALCPRARIAVAGSSISFAVRAASVTCAPASANADAAASPMPRPAPETSARLPSRRNEGAEWSCIDLDGDRQKLEQSPVFCSFRQIATLKRQSHVFKLLCFFEGKIWRPAAFAFLD